MPAAPRPNRWLLVVAAPAEARAVLLGLNMDESLARREWTLLTGPGQLDLVVSGIGKANAAAATARTLDPSTHEAVISVGVAGSLPGSPAGLLQVVVGTRSVYADEGILTPEGFTDCCSMGFPLGPFEGSAIPAATTVIERLRPLSDHAGPIAAVSTCSGLNQLADEVRARTGAIAEGMEGAAIAHVGARLGVATGELRVISNTTGDRAAQRWDLKGALAALERVIGRLRETLSEAR